MSKTHVLVRSQLWSACLGNFFEHYDTALFGCLSSFLAPLIFPEQDPIVALMLTYAIIPLGMLARPFGSLFFGYIGDTYGRKQALFISLGGMSVVSGCIALSPTYLQAGIIAPLIFCLGRIFQSFFASGEIMGGAIFLLENTEEKRHDVLSGLYAATTIGGILIASAGTTILSFTDSIEWGWRLLYLFGCITGLFGCMIRHKMPSIAIDHTTKPKLSWSISNILMVFWAYRNALLLIIIYSGFSYATYSISLILMNGFIPLVSTISKAQMMEVNTYLLILDFCALPLFGWLASKISREKMMLSASLGIILTSIPLFMLLEEATFINVIGMRICFVMLGVAFCAPFHAFAQNLVPKEHRYSIISFGYAIGSQLLGGPTATVSLWIYKETGIISSVFWYLLALAFVTSIILIRSISQSIRAVPSETPFPNLPITPDEND